MEEIKFKEVTIENWELVKELEVGAENPLFCAYESEEDYKKYIRESQVYFIVHNDACDEKTVV